LSDFPPDVAASKQGTAAAETMALSDRIAFAHEDCRKALDPRLAAFLSGVRRAPIDAKGWFQLLAGVPQDPSRVAGLRRLSVAAQRAGFPAGAAERFGSLQALSEALRHVAALDVHEEIIEQFCAMCRRIASRPMGWGDYFDCDSEPFSELARIVTLRRFHAGQISFDVMATPRAWLLKIHPFDLPSVLREVFAGMGGLGPIVMPHINYWRTNPFLIREKDFELSVWRIAKTIERQPKLKGLVTASWLYSLPVGEISPHLKWLREFYLSSGAFLVEMELAPPRAGFLVGSESRQRLYHEGRFRPRIALVMWRRTDILAWAERYERSQPRRRSPAVRAVNDIGEGLPAPRRAALVPRRPRFADIFVSGRYTLINLERFLNESPRPYIAIIFLIPCLISSILAAIGLGGIFILPAILTTAVFIWLFQYLFLQ
jgi:hypothetical protein